MLMHPPRALYIHIPFCKHRCHYCDFNTYVLAGQPVDAYLDALEREMERTVLALPPERIDTVFVGGGTPTVLTPEQMARFLGAVRRWFPVAPDAEFSVEANPGTTGPELLAAMREGGVNRISFGVQAFDDALLQRIGRIHDTNDVYRSIELAREAGFNNLSIDLMFGLPGQTMELLADSVRRAVELDLPHYSLYGLKIEENTLFHVLYERNELPLPAEEEELQMYLFIMERLEAAGRRQYEISNFALPGCESRHNMTYWRNEPYYGIGAGAHGYARGVRHVNIKGVTPYIEAANERLPRLSEDPVTENEAMEDFMMVGLRMRDGVRDADFAAQFGGRSMDDVFGGVIGPLREAGLIERRPDGAGWRLTERGIPLGNEVFGAFVGVLEGN
ncbi:Oxygen-independent coproporphyrinogen-III oxidase-like protein YqeR, Coproporphyrinogen dehydrogenase [Thermobacillus xylanilyticus]|uniref:Heme chaperone HemW n=1 Tax=Thermobacillus xylanilyticus TaxID=76633 RepID=A0ABM8V9E2_THEXY|nr:radical SAM family heme chaperone HemW [Thermobacillus xylanilyticus]REJ15185.1 MAG: oxygen-independent coproporphyrinogen III oxidase [Paenibacillaceae bacterium]CAG5093344.1 Oxygen-independent coproporphyrinogen-III oxidase-like protein YqeR, Coproporphyrinogen dehydrogenase [Thermobacillus xylanilyticus]